MIEKKLERLELDGLEHAEWNPRSSEDLSWDNPEMVKLTESVRGVGVVQPIAVWEIAGRRIVIAGNRRLEAARAAALSEIPAMVFRGLAEVQAREITRVENEVRLGISPLADAALVGSMISLGYSQKEISAHFGVSEASVCRRAKLLNLLPEIRAIAVERDCMTADALERISLYPHEIQRKCLKTVGNMCGRGVTVKWSDLKWYFDGETRELADAIFDTSTCAACLKRTGAQADLFGDVDGDGLGRCLDCACYAQQLRAAIIQKVRDRVGYDCEIVNVGDTEFGFFFIKRDAEIFGERKTKKRNVAWYEWSPYTRTIDVVYGPSLEEYRRIKAKREDDRKAEEEAEAKKRAEINDIRSRYLIIEEKVESAGDQIFDILNAVDGGAFKEKLGSVIRRSMSVCRREIVDFIVDHVCEDLECGDLSYSSVRLIGLSVDEFDGAFPGIKKPYEEFVASSAEADKFKAEHEDVI